jgi:hypothetical protein
MWFVKYNIFYLKKSCVMSIWLIGEKMQVGILMVLK